MLADDLRAFLQGWGDAWSPKNNASEFTKDRFGPFYADGDRLLAFDNTEGDMPTVIRGGAAHGDTWGPWVAQFDYWSFTPELSSAKVFGSGNVRTVALFVDVLGKLPSGDTIEGRQHVTVVIETTDEGLRIVHESIWGPVRDGT